MIIGSFHAQSVICNKELLKSFTSVTVQFIPDGYRKIFVNRPHSNPPAFRSCCFSEHIFALKFTALVMLSRVLVILPLCEQQVPI